MYFVVVAFLEMPTYVSGLNSVGLSDDSVPSLATKQPEFLRTVFGPNTLFYGPSFFPLSFNIIDNQSFFLRLKSQTN